MARITILLAAVVVLIACGAQKPASPEQVARDWSAALDRNDNEAAARLFDDGAQVVQNMELVLSSHPDAVRWNAALPCGGKIASVSRPNVTDVVLVFTLENRPRHACDAPGQRAAALFRVRGGKIVLWH
jgi:hypothetical protein